MSNYIQKEYVCRENADRLSIISGSDGIRITSGEVSSVTISYWENPGKYEYDISEAGGRVTLAFRKNGSLFSGIHFKNTSIEVIVPKSFAGAVDLQCASGEVDVKDIRPAHLTIECRSGSVNVSGITAGGQVAVRNMSGSVKVCNITGTDVTISDKSGSVHLEGVTALGTVTAELSSGTVKCVDINSAKDVTVTNKSGVVKLEDISTEGSVYSGNTSGGIHFDGIRTGGNITLKSTSGSISGSIVGKESDYSIQASTKTGSNNLTNSQNGNKALNVKTTTGSIRIKFV